MATINCTLVFLIEGDNILLAMKKRGHGKGKWNGAGGKIKLNETVEQAMVRECEEEFRVSPLEFKPVAHLEFVNQGGADTIVGDAFICTRWDGEPVETDEMAPHWFKISEIPYDEMWADDRYWLPQVLEGKFVRAVFTFNTSDALLEYKVEEL